MSLHIVRHRHLAKDTVDIAADRPRLRVAPGHGVSKPRWSVLYVIVAGVSALGFLGVSAADSPMAERLVELLMAIMLMGGIGLWVRANRVTLARCDEPVDTASESLVIHVIPSHRIDHPHFGDAAPVDDRAPRAKVVRLHPEDNVVVPYDFC